MVLADLNGDGLVDRADLIAFEACVLGPGVTQSDPACAGADLDGDGDVDQSDFGLLQRAYTGPRP
jgi:hypothetical protein